MFGWLFLFKYAIISLPLVIAGGTFVADTIEESILCSAIWTFCIHNTKAFMLKKVRTASHPYNNRHRQAPSTHTDKQAVRTMKLRTMFDYPRVHIGYHAPEQNWRFCCLRTFQFYYAVFSARIHTSKLNIFSQTIKVSDCFLQYSVFIWQSYTLKVPNLVSAKFISFFNRINQIINKKYSIKICLSRKVSVLLYSAFYLKHKYK